MAYTNFKNGFNVQTASAIDQRILLTKAEMLRESSDETSLFMLPDVYFAICSDDGNLYLYNVDNVPNSVTGKFKIIDEAISFASDEAKAQLNNAIKNTLTIQEIQENINELEERTDTLETDVTNLEERVEELEPQISDLEPRVAAAEAAITVIEGDVGDIQTWINEVRLDGGEVLPRYAITAHLSNVVADDDNPEYIEYNTDTPVLLTFNSKAGYMLPEEINVNGAVVRLGSWYEDNTISAYWNKITDVEGISGQLQLKKALTDVNFTIIGITGE